MAAINGTSGSETLNGTSGNDTLDGAAGNDQLFGGNGNDTLIGGLGNNVLYGQLGNDIFKMEERPGVYYTPSFDTIADFQTGDKIDVSAYGISSFDQLKLIFETANGTDAYFDAYYGGYDYAVQITKVAISKLAAGDFIFDIQGAKDEIGTSDNDRMFGSTASDTLNGAGGNDQLFGGNGNDTLIGGLGNDTLFGGIGNDTMIGGSGSDNYIVDSASDVVTELAGEGADTIQTNLSTYSMAKIANVENLTGTAATGQTLTGNALNNVITGGNGNDTLIGGAGNDVMIGGAGNDIYGVDSVSDVVTELANQGTDTIQTNLATYSIAKIANV
ncbi:MAG: calcium-binding protein, partial [Rhizobiaceae bacterium]|nr:calcium-binding protein [Rhizobiaceae bacterium]